MFSSRQLKYGTTYAAVEHHENGVYHLLQLKKKQKEFVISKKVEVHSFEEVLTVLKGQKHVFVILNTEDVLFKKIPLNIEDPITILSTAFPNIMITDFDYGIYKTQTTAYVSISRRVVIKHLILKYKQAGISVIDFSLGNIVVQNLQKYISETTLYTSNAAITIENSIVSDIKKKKTVPKSYQINDLTVSNTDILPLAGIITYYLKIPSSAIFQRLNLKYFHRRFFDVGLRFGLIFFVTLLLSNAFFYTSYKDQYNQLQGELAMSTTYKKQVSSLKKEITQKKPIVKSLTAASSIKLSQYIDEIGHSVPKEVLLSKIQFQPIQGAVKSTKPIDFKNNSIVVKGISRSNVKFSDWISVLEKKGWVAKVSILAYGKGKKTSRNASFEFIITSDGS